MKMKNSFWYGAEKFLQAAKKVCSNKDTTFEWAVIEHFVGKNVYELSTNMFVHGGEQSMLGDTIPNAMNWEVKQDEYCLKIPEAKKNFVRTNRKTQRAPENRDLRRFSESFPFEL